MELSQLEEYKDQWRNVLKIENKAETSIKSYMDSLKHFFDYLAENQFDLADMEITDAREFIRYRSETLGNKQTTIKRILSCINQFLNWMVKSEYLFSNPFQDVKIKRHEKSLPHVMSEEELAIFLDSELPEDSTDLDKDLWIRDRAIIEVMYSSGLRLAEVCAVKINDINKSQKTIFVESGKGSKDRVVPIGSKALEALQNWYVLRNDWDVSNEVKYCFVTYKTKKKLTPIAVWKRVVKQGKRLGISTENFNYNNMHPHMFRHCFATHLLNATDNLRAIQEMLGHENISTTAIYTQVSTARLMKEYDKAHPRAQNKSKR